MKIILCWFGFHKLKFRVWGEVNFIQNYCLRCKRVFETDLRLNTKISETNGTIMIEDESISFDGTRSPINPEEYKQGVRKVLLNVKRNE